MATRLGFREEDREGIEALALRTNRAMTVLMRDLMSMEGVTSVEMARRLGISEQSVSQRLRLGKGVKPNWTARSFSSYLYVLGYEFGDTLLEIRKTRRNDE